jgi:hypothetical protein
MPSHSRQLPVFEGYTVDYRLEQLRLPTAAGSVIPFRSPQGRKMLARMNGDCDASVGDCVQFTEAGLTRVGDMYRNQTYVVVDDPDVAASFDRDVVGDQFRLQEFDGPIYSNEIERIAQ